MGRRRWGGGDGGRRVSVVLCVDKRQRCKLVVTTVADGNRWGGGGQGVAGEGEGAVNVNKKAGGVDGHRFSQD